MLADIATMRRRTLQGTILTLGKAEWRVTREWAAVRDARGTVGEVWDAGGWSRAARFHRRRGAGAGTGGGLGAGWRAAGLPRQTLMATPAVWREGVLLAAPVAGFGHGWTARIVAPFPA